MRKIISLSFIMAFGIVSYAQTAQDYYDSGNEKFIRQDYKGAIVDYKKALDINPNLSRIYNSRGNAKGALEDNRGAMADYNKAIEINPRYSDANWDRALLEIKIGQKENACMDLSRAGELGEANAYDLIKIHCN